MEGIGAGQEIGVGQLRTSEGDTVAAVPCCRSGSWLTFKLSVSGERANPSEVRSSPSLFLITWQGVSG